MSDCTHHYDADYFEWQKQIGEFGGRANLFKFEPYIRDTDTLLEFGCGGGFLLNQIRCDKKAGVEINPVARAEVEKKGLVCYETTASIDDGWADIIISNSALEHVERPLDTLRDLHRILKPGGRIVFVVPHETKKWKYAPGDINQHLYTWSPMSLGNLFNAAGFTTKKIDLIKHYWPPYYYQIRRIFGEAFFNLSCHLYARIRGLWFPLRIVAYKESGGRI